MDQIKMRDSFFKLQDNIFNHPHRRPIMFLFPNTELYSKQKLRQHILSADILHHEASSILK